MKSLIALILLPTLIFIVNQIVSCNDEIQLEGLKTELPLPGIGYSSDRGYIAPTICFNPVTNNSAGQQSVLKFDQGMSVSQIQQEFNIASTIKGGFGMFSADALFQYLKSIEENNFQLSVSYYLKVTSSRVMTYSYNPKTILNEIGEQIYNDNQNNMFRIFCGDTLIKSYDEGAALIYNLKITLRDSQQKEKIQTELGLGLSSLFSASAQLQSISQKYNYGGSIQVSAFQLGGAPEQLGAILDPSIAQCDLRNTEKCQSLVNALIDYQKSKFPNQFKKDGNIWASPLVFLGGFVTDFKLTDFGMKIAPSFVTNEVELQRKQLILEQKKNDYYYKNFDNLIKNYPIPIWDTEKAKIQDSFNTVQRNIEILKVGVNQKQTQDCWNYPFRCLESAQAILSEINEIQYIPFQNYSQKYAFYIQEWGARHGSFLSTGSYYFYQVYTYPENREYREWYFISGLGEISNYIQFPSNGKAIYHAGGEYPTEDVFIIKQQPYDNQQIDVMLLMYSTWKTFKLTIGKYINPFYFDQYNDHIQQQQIQQ